MFLRGLRQWQDAKVGLAKHREQSIQLLGHPF